jgi:hypothetical protein
MALLDWKFISKGALIENLQSVVVNLMYHSFIKHKQDYYFK